LLLSNCLRNYLICILCLFPFSWPLLAGQAKENKSQCVNCHTNLKQLIRLCWEVEKIKPKVQASDLTSGEG
jgi:hypothetical protein